jgi:hypothetical protein
MADSSHQYDDATRRDVRQTRQPHIPVRCLVELVRADPADEGQHRDHPSWSSRRPPDPGLSAIMSERRRLINLAYRLLDPISRRLADDGRQPHLPGPLGSARARRERYVGEWIPEPLPDPAEWTSVQQGVPPPTRPTGSPWMSRSAWPSLSCSNR